MIDITTGSILAVAGFIAVVFIVGYIVRSKGQKNKADRAAAVFRARVLTELEGLYPIKKYWESEIFERFNKSVPVIEAAADEFRHFDPRNSRKSFDAALKKYSDHCREITYEACATFGIVEVEKNPEDEGPKEIFRQNVNALLSFASDK
ncbi:MAG: hypothetical protein ABFR82_15590 [Nitrospirota bacterium]